MLRLYSNKPEPSCDSLSMWEKSAMKRKITQEHLGNFKAGYVPVNETYLHKAGIRGRKSYILFAAVVFILSVAVLNLLVTITLVRVLHIGYDRHGMEFVVEPSKLLRFLKFVDMGQVLIHKGRIGGYARNDLHVTGNSQPVILQASGRKQTTFSIEPDQTVIHNVANFKVTDPSTGKQLFSTDYSDFHLPNSVQVLKVNHAQVSQISSPVGQSLNISAGHQIKMRGSEGLHMEGRELVLSAGQDLLLKSLNSSIILSGGDGVSINLENIPLVAELRDDDPRQYKICVCRHQGTLFKVPVTEAGNNCANLAENVVNNICGTYSA